ncbi:MAG: dTDP-4-dehydrorhamnose reductase [Alphaproteobacteria bacterium]|nr:dTDP-4-dehydrorhamnose reductase [Alphaproteobacteria bacterium]
MPTVQRIAVLGAAGQIGRALVQVLGERALPLPRADADLLDIPALLSKLEMLKPDAVINAAAYTAVDAAEDDVERCMAINAQAPAKLAEWCAARGIPFVHFSTDYVYDGSGEKPWRETDAANPLNRYGTSKKLGDEGVQAVGGKHLIFRTSWVYDAVGRNFLTTMLRLGAEKEQLRVVADQFGAPSYAPHLAVAVVSCLEKAMQMDAFPYGVYHMANAGETSWHGFAQAIFASAVAAGAPQRVKDVEPIPSVAYPTRAGRPLNSRLNCSKLHTVFGERLPTWEQGLSDAMESSSARHRLPD